MENHYKAVQLKDNEGLNIMPITTMDNILTPSGESIENILLNVENKIDNVEQAVYTAGYGITIDENNVISCMFIDGTEEKY